MMWGIIVAAIAVFGLAVPGAVTARDAMADGTPVPVGIPGNWHLVFDDEFTGTTLNTANWSTGWFGDGVTSAPGSNPRECMSPSEVAVNGELDLTLIKRKSACGGTTQPSTSGMVTTNGKFEFTYGAAEAKIWVPGPAGTDTIEDWPAWWLNGQVWPTDGELDVLEGFGGACAFYHSQNRPAPGSCTSGQWTGGWHTFAVDWEPGAITWYYDGSEVWNVTNATPGVIVRSSPMYLVLGLGTYGGPPPTPVTMRVQYVRVWRQPVTVTYSGTIRLTQMGYCLDDRGNSASNGGVVQVWRCNGLPNQQWQVMSDGTIRINGLCLDAPDHGITNGTKVQLWACTGRPNQQWNTRNWRVNYTNPAASNQVLDDPGYGGNGTQQELWANTGTRNQIWATN